MIRITGKRGQQAILTPAEPAHRVEEAEAREHHTWDVLPKPVVVWNITNACNLSCRHCYSSSAADAAACCLPLEKATLVVEELLKLSPPMVLVSGGEPLLYPGFFRLAKHAAQAGLKLALSTNGTLITADVAKGLIDAGFQYVGISLDGIGETNDAFRGVEGAFDRAVAGFRNCMETGLRVGLRMTMVRDNLHQLDETFDFIEAEDIPRACFYHLCYSGRGADLLEQALEAGQTRKALDLILARAQDFLAQGKRKEILTVANHADAPYLYMKLRAQNEGLAQRALQYLRQTGGGLRSSGVGICSIDWEGNVHPDQFWMDCTVGNVLEQSLEDIWCENPAPILTKLRNRRDYIKGRCSPRACRWFDICGGSMRARANAFFNDPWAPDPACYLTDEEIGLEASVKAQLKREGQWFVTPVETPKVGRTR